MSAAAKPNSDEEARTSTAAWLEKFGRPGLGLNPASHEFQLPAVGPAASYAWCSSQQLLVAKGGRQIALDRADLATLRAFLARFDTDPTADGA